MRLSGKSEKRRLVLDGDENQEVRFGVPCLRGGWISTGIREGRMSGLGSLISSAKIGSGDDIELVLLNLRGRHVLRFSLNEVTSRRQHYFTASSACQAPI